MRHNTLPLKKPVEIEANGANHILFKRQCLLMYSTIKNLELQWKTGHFKSEQTAFFRSPSEIKSFFMDNQRIVKICSPRIASGIRSFKIFNRWTQFDNLFARSFKRLTSLMIHSICLLWNKVNNLRSGVSIGWNCVYVPRANTSHLSS